MITRSLIDPLLAPNLKKVWYEEYDLSQTKYKSIYNVMSSTRAYEEWTGAVGAIGLAQEKPEGTGINYIDPSVLTPKRINMVTFGLGMRMTMEAMQDNQYRPLSTLAGGLGRGFAVKEEIDGFSILNLGFTTVVATGWDNLALFSASHVLKGPRFAPTSTDLTAQPTQSTLTWSNVLATPSDLSYTSWQDMGTLVRRQVDYDGQYIPEMAIDTLVIPPELHYVAKELTRAPGNPGSPNLTTNLVADEIPNTLTSQYLLDTDAWFVKCKRHDLTWFDRMALAVQKGEDFNTGDELLRGFRRYGFGFHNPMGWFASPGA